MKRVRNSSGQMRLLGGRCEECGHLTIPHRAVCPSCRSISPVETYLGPHGTVERSSDLLVPTDGVHAPYWVGLVRLAEGPLVFARVKGEVEPGDPVQLQVDEVSDTYWFTTSDDTHNEGNIERRPA